MSSSVKSLFLASLETALNRYLTLDEHIEQYLTPMAGKVIELRIDTFSSSLYFCPTAQGIQILESYPSAVDATLSGSLSALGLMGLSATPMRSLFKGEVRIEGDTQLARRLQRLFEKLDINLESKIARYTGDAFAQRLAKLFRGSRDWTQQTLTTFRLNLEEFLQEETRELPAKSEAELFFREIDTCRSDCDRLSARLDRLEASIHPTSAPQ
ncbi:ubiquinone biosynthesis accessory factor UbiJ [Methylomonas rosea]|uniref:Ubiquinone biosynthesis accessory factor UbiJ n=1 Tax=Methylomonas rosea TaxID=2952227 RepID=A0ABT1TSW8_9GAMM|nr:SCP2 sterol-binding domain-containing protein [Methylomonas sp. WSC-7]MCQ8117168.1 SCP2 sterol-binding domain-containing protein [Methylomonas sp. WSC-7]